MAQEVVQWLREIQELQQQVAAAQQARVAAEASADNWRQRYEIEAQQRRTEANSARQAAGDLRTELALLQGPPPSPPIAQSAITQAISQLATTAQLQAKLLEIWTERDRLAHTLKIEQANHIQTRKNLTLALGDTMEILKSRLPQNHSATDITVEEMTVAEPTATAETITTEPTTTETA